MGDHRFGVREVAGSNPGVDPHLFGGVKLKMRWVDTSYWVRNNATEQLTVWEILEPSLHNYPFTLFMCDDMYFCFSFLSQHALRLIVFRQIHKVLGMEPLYTQARNLGRRGNRNRKRRRDGDDADGDDGKKLKGCLKFLNKLVQFYNGCKHTTLSLYISLITELKGGVAIVCEPVLLLTQIKKVEQCFHNDSKILLILCSLSST